MLSSEVLEGIRELRSAPEYERALDALDVKLGRLSEEDAYKTISARHGWWVTIVWGAVLLIGAVALVSAPNLAEFGPIGALVKQLGWSPEWTTSVVGGVIISLALLARTVFVDFFSNAPGARLITSVNAAIEPAKVLFFTWYEAREAAWRELHAEGVVAIAFKRSISARIKRGEEIERSESGLAEVWEVALSSKEDVGDLPSQFAAFDQIGRAAREFRQSNVATADAKVVDRSLFNEMTTRLGRARASVADGLVKSRDGMLSQISAALRAPPKASGSALEAAAEHAIKVYNQELGWLGVGQDAGQALREYVSACAEARDSLDLEDRAGALAKLSQRSHEFLGAATRLRDARSAVLWVGLYVPALLATTAIITVWR